MFVRVLSLQVESCCIYLMKGMYGLLAGVICITCICRRADVAMQEATLSSLFFQGQSCPSVKTWQQSF